jgi:phosphopantothenoylcysteine decarboxylase/phosphopantothenate--cysteine ligase
VLAGKTVVLGVTGGIAAYKAAEIVRWLKKEDAAVVVVMTDAAKRFITPLTLATLSGNPVLDDLWGPEQALAFGRPRSRTSPVEHIEVADAADLVLVAPATADFIARLAHGMGDDLLTTVLLATRAPVILAPAMNVQMWENPIVQENLARLRGHGVRFVDPEAGELACGWEGRGRLASLEAIAAAVSGAMSSAAASAPAGSGRLAGRHVVVTAGPTREPLDPVRALTNHSSGRMGFALAEAARDAGARVTLVHGPVALAPPAGVTAVAVETAREMGAALRKAAARADAVIMAAAVADFRPARPAAQKLRRDGGGLTLELVANPDLLATLPRPAGLKVVGFALETEHELDGARRKLADKKCDLLVMNNPTRDGSRFGGATNEITILDARGGLERLPVMDKRAAAGRVVERLAALFAPPRAAARAKAKTPAKRPAAPARRRRGRA